MTQPRPTPRPTSRPAAGPAPGSTPRPGSLPASRAGARDGSGPTATPAPVIPVVIPAPLRSLTGGAAEVSVRAGTVGEALDALLARHSGLRRHLRTEAGALREHINVFVNEDEIRVLDGEATPMSPSAVVTIVPSIAGG